MELPRIFNVEGNDLKEFRPIWYGNTTNLINLNNVRYEWGIQLYKQMRENFWISQRLDITQDVTAYKNLTEEERRGFNGILSYLTFLDSIQVANIPHLKLPITAPEISICLSEQASQESLHNESYQYMLETIILDKDERNKIYDFWRTDKVLKNRCQFIASLYQKYIDDSTPENYFSSLVADYILESLFFFNGFAFFYNLASRLLMGGCADIFRLINRDELSHVRLFQKLITEGMEVFPCSKEQIYEMVDTAVNHEIEWTNHIVGDAVLGINFDTTDRYTKYLANLRLKAIGLDKLYSDDQYNKNVYNHLEKFADISSEGNTKSNFFESTVTSYSMSSSLSGWDEF